MAVSTRRIYVLGINDGIVATACLLCDGAVVACASEERFSRRKNHAGLPVRAIQYCLQAGGIDPGALDLVALATATMPPFFLDNGASAQRRRFNAMVAVDRWLIERHHPWATRVERMLYDQLAPRAGRRLVSRRTEVISRLLEIPHDRIVAFDHHRCHGAAALWASPFVRQGKAVLVLTCDGEGDGFCATVGVYQAGQWRSLAKTHLANSLGHFYSAVTQYLGMRPHDHEYKVMGLAPYAPPAEREAALARLRELLSVRADLTFQAPIHMRACLSYLEQRLRGIRFDAIAAAAQALTEEILTAWATRAIAQSAVGTVAAGGGVFMNVKANMSLAGLTAVQELFVMPSAGDESTALGAAYLAYQQLRPGAAIEPIGDLFWGPALDPADIRQALASADQQGLIVTEPASMPEAIAELLQHDQVVAYVTGRMEWGARALGHRSLLANPAQPGVVDTINQAIKQRDFWMPFAPAILETAQARYLEFPSPRKVNAQHMMVTFRATPQAQQELIGAMHPYDKTLRAQVVTPRLDPQYSAILQRFGERTGRHGLINTSYNIHGEPMVCTASDAISTLQRSGLRYLALGSYLVAKRGPHAAR